MIALIFVICLSPLKAWALDPSDTYTWVKQQIPADHQEQLYSYYDLSESFHGHVLSWVNGQLAKSAKYAVNIHKQRTCTESALFQSMDPKKIVPNPSTTEQKFLNSLFIIESSYCLPGATLNNTHTVFMSSSFRERFMPQVSNYTITSEGSCIQSSGVPGILLPTSYCSKIETIKDQEQIVIYSSMSSVQMDDEHEPMYLREEVMVLSQIPDGVTIYRASFSRSQDLGTTSKYILRNTVDNSQTKIRDGLYAMIEH